MNDEDIAKHIDCWEIINFFEPQGRAEKHLDELAAHLRAGVLIYVENLLKRDAPLSKKEKDNAVLIIQKIREEDTDARQKAGLPPISPNMNLSIKKK